MRLRLTFSKTDAMKFTGNLDLHRTLTRTIRRANLPLAYSQGFNPHPKITLASALPLGYTSNAEVADIWLSEPADPQDMLTAVRDSAPPGLTFEKIIEVEQSAPKLQVSIQSVKYRVTFPKKIDRLEPRVVEMLAEEEIMRAKIRKGKKRVYDLRALILGIELLSDDPAGNSRLELHLQAGEGKTGRPDEVLDALGLDALEAQIHRTQISFADS